MSVRFKRQISKAGSSTNDSGGGGKASGAMARKKRKLEMVGSEDEERSFWTPKHLGDLKAYNRSASEAPAELFRKDLISAMKLPDNEPLAQGDYWGISDQWKQEWERGVQVPVNPDSLPQPTVREHKNYPKINTDFRLAKRKIRVTHNDFFNNERHVLSNLPTKADKMCRYDIDNLDDSWLKAYNGGRARMGAEPVPHHIFELIVEHLEETCWESIHKLLKSEETLSIEFDDDVICDVCRSPDREEGNEMVFCDICNICVHQACYGITAIPSGSWLCRTCSLGIKPNCNLCPNKGGAMKSTKSGHKWAHVACALWIPEVSIGSVERMEPITKIANIPQSRWALVCVLCRERRGACIQCSVKSCKTAYHVTCAFKHGLEMKAIIEDENADDVKLRSYCEKHSLVNKKEQSDAESEAGNVPKKKKDMTNEQRNQARASKLRQIEGEFYNHVSALTTSTVLDIDFETTETIFYYWKLKRKSGFNKPLLMPRSHEMDFLSEQQEQDIERMKMFVQLRQYLERVRNLCYMVSRREKLSKSFLKLREQTFSKQVKLVGDSDLNLEEQEAVTQANHGHFIYDKLYSHSRAPVHNQREFEQIVRLIAGTKQESINSEEEEKDIKSKLSKDINGLIKSDKGFAKGNPYKKTYINGAVSRQSRSRSMSHCESSTTTSTEESDSSLPSDKWKPPEPGVRISVFTSSEDEKVPLKNKHNNTKSKSSIEVSKIKSLDTSDDEEPPKILTTPIKSGRGRGKRGRGRPRGSTKTSARTIKENAIFSSEEDKFNTSRESKMFDDLINSTPPIKKEEKCPYSSDEEDTKKKVKKSTRGRGKKSSSTMKNEVLSSSDEDDLVPSPSKSTPRKKGRGRGRGRGSSSKSSVSSTNLLSSWTLPTKISDEDDLGPATYKLTSDEEDKSDEKSIKSVVDDEIILRRRDLFGSSDDENKPKSISKSDSDNENKSKSISKSDSDKSDEEEARISGNESFSSQMKTKAAMKQFAPKFAAKAEKFNRKRSSRSSHSEKSKEPTVQSSKTDVDTDLSLFVPQRAAAKKASVLITSQNTLLPNAAAPEVSAETTTPEKKVLAKPVNKDQAVESDTIVSSTEDSSPKKRTPSKPRRGRSQREKNDKDDSDTEPPKINIFEEPKILPYLPVREAAKKAAENLKGAGKGGENLKSAGKGGYTTAAIVEDPEPVISPSKQKKVSPTKLENKTLPSRQTRLTKSPRISAKGHGPHSDEDNQVMVSSPVEKHRESMELREEKPKSIFSESDEDVVSPSPKKEKASPEKVDGTKHIPQKQQLFRGDFFLRDHQSSSENSDVEEKQSNKSSHRNREHARKESKEKKSKEHRNRMFDRNETENFEPPPAETRRKAPDKKLKTSDGRPEHGFQPPAASRDESRTSINSHASGGTSLGGTECGRRTPSDHLSPSPTTHRELAKKEKNKESAPLQLKDPCPPTKTDTKKGFKSTFECISTSEQEAPPLRTNKSVFNFTEKQIEVRRLEDIEETSDVEPEPKKTRISNKENNLDVDDQRVKQPEDSGYKSAIATPEPSEKNSNESNHQNNIKEHLSPEVRKLSQQQERENSKPKISPIKLSALTKKKNLEDVIEERKKLAEQTDFSDKRLSSDSSPSQESDSMHFNPAAEQQMRENSNPMCGSISAGSSVGSNSSAPSSFVEEWREQWSKSPLPPLDGQPPYGSHPMHPNLGHFNDMNYPYGDNHYTTENLLCFIKLRQMQQAQAAYFQMYGIQPPTHDNKLEEEQTRHLQALQEYQTRLGIQQKIREIDIAKAKSFAPKMDPSVSAPSISETENSTSHVSLSMENEPTVIPITISNKPQVSQTVTVVDEEKLKCKGSSSIFSGLTSTSASTSTVTTSSSKIVSMPSPSPSSSNKTSIPPCSKAEKVSWSPPVSSHVFVSTKSPASVTGTSVISSSTKTSPAKVVNVCSPISSVMSPVTQTKAIKSSPRLQQQDIITIDTSVLTSRSPTQKRIPIYKQEPKPVPRSPEKRSPRCLAPVKKERRPPAGKGNRGKRGKGKKGRIPRYNSASVPKELQGTVYDFDFDDEFGDDGPANNTLDDLRQLREKRQSVDSVPPAVPPSQNLTPTYNVEIKDKPPKKRVKEKKGKKTPKREEVDEVAKILEDYRNQQKSTLKRSVHEPSPPQIGSPVECKKNSPPSEFALQNSFPLDDSINAASSYSEEKEKEINEAELTSSTYTSSAVVTSSFSEVSTNQLKLKIKGPYANPSNSYISSNVVPSQEASSNPAPPSATSNLRRMRKKELIRQYCEQIPEQTESATINSSSIPPLQMRTGITLPKAITSMTSIPTREDYKRYTQDDSSSRTTSSGRRRRQPRDAKQDWTVVEEKGKRSKDASSDSSRKRQRLGLKDEKVMDSTYTPATGKLKITIGKKVPEVSQVIENNTSTGKDIRDISSKGKPPKKRHPEESMIMKVMSDSLRYREAVMADFDKSKSPTGEKKTKKRKTGRGSEGTNSPADSESRGEDSLKLVLKLNKNGNGGINNKISAHPLKLRLNLASLNSKGSDSDSKHENNSRSSSKERIQPLKITLQRRPDGYVTSNLKIGDINQGPGPPEPPDPPSSGQNNTSKLPPPVDSNAKTHTPPLTNCSETLPPAPEKKHSRISDDMLKEIEARLARADSGIPFFGPTQSSTALQPVPTIKDDSGCR